MRPLRPLLGSFIAVLVSLAAACGGKVVVDAPSGGAGGAGGGDATSTGTVPTGPSTGSGTMDLCAQLCSFWDVVACPMMGCEQQCTTLFQEAGPCTAKLTDAIQCILDHPNEASMCLMPGSCIDAINAYQDCVAPPPPTPSCDDLSCFAGPDGSCGCKGSCAGMAVGVECSQDSCTCFVNGAAIGSCVEGGPTCDPTNGCCAAFFFPQGK